VDPGNPPFPDLLTPPHPLGGPPPPPSPPSASQPGAPGAASPAPGVEYDYWFKVASLVEAKLHYEAGWTAHRMMWLVVSQSFLFSAFATTVQNGRPAFAWGAPASWLLWVLPALGLAQATAASVSMRSSRKCDHAILVARGRIEERLRALPGLADLPLLGYDNRTGPLRRTIFTGSMASRVIPVTLIVAWSLMLASVLIGAVVPGTTRSPVTPVPHQGPQR
jgi:hypothetical protein